MKLEVTLLREILVVSAESFCYVVLGGCFYYVRLIFVLASLLLAMKSRLPLLHETFIASIGRFHYEILIASAMISRLLLQHETFVALVSCLCYEILVASVM